MIQQRKFLAIIPARAGSKRIINKSMIPLKQKPLIEWTFEATKKSKYIDHVVVTSDHGEVVSLAKKYNFQTIKRPTDLADDYAKSSDVVMHVLQQAKDFDYFVLLQPTSPLRTSDDIDRAIELIVSSPNTSCISVCKAKEKLNLMVYVSSQNIIQPVIEVNEILRSQDYVDTFIINGAIYIHKIQSFLIDPKFTKIDTLAFNMPIERSIDIDTYEDLKEAQRILE